MPCAVKSSPEPFDVLSAGAIAVDEVLLVAQYPPPDHKVEVLERRRECGGLAATALVAASRLGARCAYAGELGDDELSTFVLASLSRAGVDIKLVVRKGSAAPIYSTIIIDQESGTRNIFFDASRFVGPSAQCLSAPVVNNAHVLLIDHFATARTLSLARLARGAGVSIVADFETQEGDPGFCELVSLTNHLVVSDKFACSVTGIDDPAQAVDALWAESREAVVITSGAHGSWYRGLVGGVQHCPAFPANVVDTTGCGDVFHGAYATGLARGLDLPTRVRLASAAAALASEVLGGQAGAPTAAMVTAFLAKEGPG